MLLAFEELEITDDVIKTPEVYADFLILHYITNNWDNTAKFLWKRIPHSMQKDKVLKKVWEIGQDLYSCQFILAAQKINEFKGSKLDNWLKDGYKYLMHRLINKMYSSIDDSTFQALMGFASSKEQKEYMKNHIDDFATHESEDHVEISEEHMKTLKLLAQFIEKENVTQLDREP